MNTHLKSFLRIASSILFALLFLYLAFRGSDFDKLIASLKQANYFWVLSLLPCMFISHFFRAWRWKYLVRPIKKDVSLRNLFSSLMVGYMVNNALPRVGEIVRAYNLGRLEKVSKSAVFGTVLVERIIDILTFLFLLAGISLFYQTSLGEVFPWLESATIIVTILTLAAFGIFAFLLAKRDLALGWMRVLTSKLSPVVSQKVERLFHSFLDGFLVIREPRQYLLIAVFSVVIWFWYVLMVYLPFFAFGMVERYSVNFFSAVVVVVLSAIGFIIPAPGGTGTYHWITREGLVRLFGVDVEVALGFATVTHLVGFIAVTLVGLVYFLRDNLKVSEAIGSKEPNESAVELVADEKL